MTKVLGVGLKIVGLAAFAAVQFVPGLNIAADAALLAFGLAASYVGDKLTSAGKDQKAAASALAASLNTRVDPLSPAIWLFGEYPMPLQLVYAEVYDSEKRAVQVLGGLMHPVSSIEGLAIEGTDVTFGDGSSANSATAPSDWSGNVGRAWRTGTEVTPSGLESTNLFSGHSFPSTAKGEGIGWFALAWNLENDKINSIPTRLTQLALGMPVYDPRMDSTRGGSGSQRADDQTTWDWNGAGSGATAAGSNWALVVTSYMLGWKLGGELALGQGKSPDSIDWDSVIAIANVCDEITSDGIPRYHVGGQIRLDGDHESVIGELEATVGGKVSLADGLYSLWVPYDDLSTPSWTIGEDDLLREVGVVYEDATDITGRYNTARGQYTNPDAGWVPDSYADVVEPTMLSEDGVERALSIDFMHLTNETRAQRVVMQMLRRTYYGRTWRVGVGPAFLNAKVFDVVTLNIQETNDSDTTVRIVGKQLSVRGAIVLTLAEEDSSIYSYGTLNTPAGRNDPPATEGETIWATSGVVLALVLAGDSTGQPYYAVSAVAGATDIYITFTTDGTDPADPTAGAYDVHVSGRSGNGTLGSTVAEGTRVRAKAVAANANGALGPVSPISEWTYPVSGTGTGLSKAPPSVQAVPSQSGGVGTLTLTIADPDAVVTGVFFAQKTDSGGYSAFVEDTTAPYESSVTLDPKHNVAIAYRVDYTIDAQNFSVGGDVSFDADVTPEVSIASVSRDTDGTVLIGLHGDEDAANVYVTWNIGSSPSAPADPTTADTALGAATGVLDTGVVADVGQFAYVKAAAADGSGNLGPVAVAKVEVSPGYIAPTVQETPSQSGSTGTLTLAINDPQGHVTGVYFAQKTDSGGFGSFSLDSTPPYASSVTLDPKHPVAIAWRVDYDDIDGSSKSVGGSFSFDIDTTANVHVVATVDDSGNCVIDVVGDEDTVGSYATAAVGSDPADPTTGSYDLHIASRSGSGTVLSGVAEGDTVHVKVKGYNGSALGPVATAKATRPTSQPPDGSTDQKPTVAFSRTASGTTSETFTITATAGPGSPAPVLQVRYRYRISNSAYSAWTAWASSPQTGVVISRDYFYDTVVEAQSRDTSISNYVSAAGYVTVVGQMEALDPGSGKLDPGAAVYGGGGVFVKGAPTDPDDLSSVPDVAGTSGRYAPDRLWKYIGASDTWVNVGHVQFGRNGGIIKLEHISGRGSGSGNLGTSRAEITVRLGNGTAAPNIQGAWSVETGSTPGYGPAITDLKIVSTGGSGTGVTQFDVYAKVRGYSGGTWVLAAQTDDASWTFDGTSTTDPGAASSTVFVGDVKHQFTHEGNIVSGMEVDSGAANKAPVGGVVSSSSTPSGAYPDGTIWAVV